MLELLSQRFGDRLRRDEPLARLSSARVGGPAEALIEAQSADELAEIVAFCWQHELPHLILGGATNVLISDAGVRGLVILNRARQVRFDEGGAYSDGGLPTVWAESGVNFGSLARQACARGLSGLEWAVGIPGTLGGALVGNAGAHGGDIAGNLILAEILHRRTYLQTQPERLFCEEWPVERFKYSYRSSLLKEQPGEVLVLAALLRLNYSSPEKTQAKAEAYTEQRHRTQPPGASMGSMFKNPPGDYAGRLIEAAGLKGTAVGDAQISDIHANFFVNHGRATAADIDGLIRLARRKVFEHSGTQLELEIERVGEWRE